MCDLVYYLQNRFDCPVICTGDYNCTRDSEEFQQYARRSGVADAQTDAAQTEGAQYRSTHTVGSMPDTGKKSIDHITYTSGARAVFFALLTDARILTASDHCPILTDFALDAPEV